MRIGGAAGRGMYEDMQKVAGVGEEIREQRKAEFTVRDLICWQSIETSEGGSR